MRAPLSKPPEEKHLDMKEALSPNARNKRHMWIFKKKRKMRGTARASLWTNFTVRTTKGASHLPVALHPPACFVERFLTSLCEGFQCYMKSSFRLSVKMSFPSFLSFSFLQASQRHRQDRRSFSDGHRCPSLSRGT